MEDTINVKAEDVQKPAQASRYKGKGVVCYVPLDPSGRNIPLGGKYKFTYGLCAMCFAAFLQLVILGGIRPISENPLIGPSVLILLDGGGMSQTLIRHGQWWRLIWANFLHAGWLHLILNMVVWIPLGQIMEPEWGFLRYGLCFLVAGFTGCFISATLDGVNVSVGASGGIYGVMFALHTYILEYWSTIPRAGAYFLACVISSILAILGSFIPMIDVYAHIGGGIGGLLFSLATIKRFDFGVGEAHGKNWSHNIRPVTDADAEALYNSTYEGDLALDIRERPTAASPTSRPAAVQENAVVNVVEHGSEDEAEPNHEENSLGVEEAAEPIKRATAWWRKVPGVKHYLRRKETQYIPDSRTHFMYLIGKGTTAPISKITGRPRRVVINAAAHRTTIRRTRVLGLRPAKYEHSIGLWVTRLISGLLLLAIWAACFTLLFGCPECYTAPGQPMLVRRPPAASRQLYAFPEPEIVV